MPKLRISVGLEVAAKFDVMTTYYAVNALFRAGGEPRLDADLTKLKGVEPYLKYAQAYFHCANELIHAVENDTYRIATELAVYPIAFLYRHGIELYLKHLVPRLSSRANAPVAPKLTHKLSDNWATLLPLLKNDDDVVPDDEKIAISVIADILDDFLAFDPTGEEFRFPELRDGRPSLRGGSIVNLEVLRDGMSILEDYFDRWSERAR